MATAIPHNDAHATAWSAAAATGGAIVRAHSETSVGIVSDTRAIAPGCAFVALRGETHDGHDYIEDAEARGATLIVTERGRSSAVAKAAVVEVADTLVAWGDLARAHLRAWRRGREKLGRSGVIAITGSAGKTTTKELCAALLGAACHKTAGNLNNRVGVPAVLFGARADHAYVVLEMGMSVPGEIAKLAAIAEPDVALVTNVGVAHAEGLGGGRADVAREKGFLYEALGSNGAAIVNADDAAAMGQLTRTFARRSESFGHGASASYRLVDRAAGGAGGSRLTFERPKGKKPETLRIDFPLVGEAAAIDFLAALAAAEAASGVSLPPDAIESALGGVRLEGRGAVRALVDGTLVIDDTYNANPDSMRAALKNLAEIAGARRKIVVFGEMKELGPVAREEHDRLGSEIAAAGVTLGIGCGGLIDLALDRAEKQGIRVIKTPCTDAAAKVADAEIRAGDVVLVKGSRSVGTEKVVLALVNSRGAA